MNDLNSTPRAGRVHIGFFGRRNSGKSSLINNLANQEVTIVSDQPGTTTDPVLKAIELPKLGPCVLQDTAGFDDEGELGQLRVDKSRFIAEKTDIAVILIPADLPENELNTLRQEKEWLQSFQKRRLPVLLAVSKADKINQEKISEIINKLRPLLPENPDLIVKLDNGSPKSAAELRERLCALADVLEPAPFITGKLVKAGDTVLLVMPQDIQAPQGRLILPQVQTIRELLDRRAFVVSTAAEGFPAVLEKLSLPPNLIITDSQVFAHVYAHKPAEIPLTSFSVLFAAYKGDLAYYLKGAEAFDSLIESSRILIAECCSHVPLNE
ncbi:[bacterium]|nr:[FeFe] hydrogenase H-cluster maturation GTPase HydF [bacterium]